MNINDEIQEFLDGNDTVAKELADAVYEINKEMEAGDYDAEVAQELINDAVEVAEARMEAGDLDTKVKIDKIVRVAIAVLSKLK